MVREHLRGIGLLAVIGVVVWAFYGRDEAPDEVAAGRARAALEIHYLAEDIYSTVRCSVARGGNGAGRTWILCRGIPVSGATGGLYTIDTGDNGAVRVWAVNGRAIQHIGGRGAAPILYDDNSDPVGAGVWGGEPLDIPAALALF